MIELLIIIALLLGSAYFAGTELAVTMSSRVRLRTQRESGSRLAEWAEELLHQPERAIAICLVGNNLVNVAITIYGRQTLLQFLPGNSVVVDSVTALLMIPALLLFGEIIPKAVSQNYPNRVLMLGVVPLRVVRIVLAPLLWLALGVADIVRRLSGQRRAMLEFASREELKQFVAHSEMGGHVDAEERDLIYHIFEFWKRTPASFVRPLDSITTVRDSVTAGEVKEIMRHHRLEVLPVTNEAGDAVVGVVDVSLLLGAANSTPILECVDAPVRMDLALGLERLLAQLQLSTSQLAVVRAADGKTGIVLMDDLLEELMGGMTTRAH